VIYPSIGKRYQLGIKHIYSKFDKMLKYRNKHLFKEKK